MRRCILVHYDEIGLKGRNRPVFVGRLSKNLLEATHGLDVTRVRRVAGRLVLELPRQGQQLAAEGTGIAAEHWEELRGRLQTVFGVASFAPAFITRPDLPHIEMAVRSVVAARPFATFAIVTRRGNRQFPLTSTEVNSRLGAMVQQLTKARVNLDRPELAVHVEISYRDSFVYVDRVQGAGGLPVGMGGYVLALLSGGFDSPVAAYRMMKRGSRVAFVHFHSSPFLSATSIEKACELAQLLTRHQFQSELHLVPFGEIQRHVVLRAPEPPRVIIYRRLMVRIAQAIAERAGANALATGESLGQVASQTLENMAVIDAAAGMLVLRPLVGWDKREIVDEARRIGTYDISALPDEDCCTLFVPRHPATRSTVEALEECERHLDIDRLVVEALERAEVKCFHWPPDELRVPASQSAVHVEEHQGKARDAPAAHHTPLAAWT